MSVSRDDMAAVVGERAWVQLSILEALHREIQCNHEHVMRKLDLASQSYDRRELQIAWNQYRTVVADLSRITEEIGSLRITIG